MNKKYIKINKFCARWSNKKDRKSDVIFVDSDTLIKMIVWLIDNTYVKIGDKVFRQMIGIPMGTDCAPFLANLFLFSYEFQWTYEKLKKKKFYLLNKFKYYCRYIDDLLLSIIIKLYVDSNTKFIHPSSILRQMMKMIKMYTIWI